MVNTIHKNSGSWELVNLEPTERSSIARCADYPGRVPFIGSAISAVRMVSSVTIGIFASLGRLFSIAAREIQSCRGSENAREWDKRAASCKFTLSRSTDEFGRGLLELIPTFSLFSDWVATAQEEKGEITDGARGRYIYETQGGFLCYSKKAYEKRGAVTDRMNGSIVTGTIIIVDNYTIAMVENLKEKQRQDREYHRLSTGNSLDDHEIILDILSPPDTGNTIN